MILYNKNMSRRDNEIFSAIIEPAFAVTPEAREFLYDEVREADNIIDWLDVVEHQVKTENPRIWVAREMITKAWGLDEDGTEIDLEEGILTGYRLMEIQADMDNVTMPKVTQQGLMSFLVRMEARELSAKTYLNRSMGNLHADNSEYATAIRELPDIPKPTLEPFQKRMVLIGGIAVFDLVYGQEKPTSILAEFDAQYDAKGYN